MSLKDGISAMVLGASLSRKKRRQAKNRMHALPTSVRIFDPVMVISTFSLIFVNTVTVLNSGVRCTIVVLYCFSFVSKSVFCVLFWICMVLFSM